MTMEAPKFFEEEMPAEQKLAEEPEFFPAEIIAEKIGGISEEEKAEIGPENLERLQMIKEDVERKGGILRKFHSKVTGTAAIGLIGLSLLAAVPEKAEARSIYGFHPSSASYSRQSERAQFRREMKGVVYRIFRETTERAGRAQREDIEIEARERRENIERRARERREAKEERARESR